MGGLDGANELSEERGIDVRILGIRGVAVDLKGVEGETLIGTNNPKDLGGSFAREVLVVRLPRTVLPSRKNISIRAKTN